MSTVTARPEPDAAALGLPALGGRWGQRLATATAVATLAQKAVAWAKGKAGERSYTVSVHDSDAIYHHVQAWVLDKMPARHQRALIAQTDRRHEPSRGGLTEVSRELRLFYDGSRQQEVTIDGHAVKVSVDREGPPAGDGEASDSYRHLRPAKVVFTAPTLPARDAVVAFLRQVANDVEMAKVAPTLWTATKWGEWRAARGMPPRPLDSVALRAGQLEALVVDLRDFLAAEGDYVRLGIPWHRGYVFHGPPGTGKTSTAKALAAHLGLDVHYVPLSDLAKDTDLNNLVSQVDQRSVLLLEDIDVVHAARDRDDTDGGITLSGILNALDGVITPHGLVTIMTTNNIDALDGALLRPGRADRVEYMGHLDDDQLARLVAAMTGHRPKLPPCPEGLTAADVVEVVKRHLGSPGEAVAAIRGRLTAREAA
ncbi:MAG TPA: AAA family ATPase [Propionibacteriaceae bacterium]|nr:AAA family ATPase [Propionibacteriaceae bacterium]